MDKFQAFLQKKAEKSRPLKRNALEAKILADNAKQQVIESIPGFELGHEYSSRYLNSIESKFMALDRKVLPEFMSDAMEADIALQRLKAFERAENYSAKFLERKKLELSGTNSRIPEWAIIRDDEVIQDNSADLRVISFPKQFHTENPPNLDIKSIVEACKSDSSCKFSEPKAQGFRNQPTEVIPLLADPEIAPKGFFRNYLEVARFNSTRPFTAWVEAQGRDERPILTLRNRAKPLKPIFSRGSAKRPFPVELGGVVYFCEGDTAEEIFFLLPQQKRKYYAQCCVVAALRPLLSAKYIVEKNLEYGFVEKIHRAAEIPLANELDEKNENFKRWENSLYNLKQYSLDRLVSMGELSPRHLVRIEEQRTIRGMLPAMDQFLYLLDADRREEHLRSHREKEEQARGELISLLGHNCFKSILDAETSIFDDLSDEEGGFGLFGEEEDEYAPIEEETPIEEEPEEPEEVPLDHSLNLADQPAPDLNREEVLFDPRFISEIRLWPVSHKYWEPP